MIQSEINNITSLYLKSVEEEGYTEILPLHKTINLTLPSQLLLIKKEGDDKTVCGLNITEGILNIIHPQINRTLINISVYDFEWVVVDGINYSNLEVKEAELLTQGSALNQFQLAILGYSEVIAKSDQIIKSEFVPQYNSQSQELRDIEKNIKIEFEQGLKG